MGSRYTKGLPEFVYFIEGSDGWFQGPFVNPKKGYNNKKFKLTEIKEDEPAGRKKL